MIGNGEQLIPDLAEPIEAWRCWGIRRVGVSESGALRTGLILKSPFGQEMWPPRNGYLSNVRPGHHDGVVRARCKALAECCEDAPSNVTAGHAGKGCGLYAYKTPEALGWAFPIEGIKPINCPVDGKLLWGKVLLWGRVYEHDLGYRAQFAQVHSLAALEQDTEEVKYLIAMIAEDYGVGVEMIDDAEVKRINKALRSRRRKLTSPIVIFRTLFLAMCDVAADMLIEADRIAAAATGRLPSVPGHKERNNDG